MNKVTALAAAVVLAAGFAWAAVPGVGVSADTNSDPELPIIPISDDSGSSSAPDYDSSSAPDSNVDSQNSQWDSGDSSQAEPYIWKETEDEAAARELKISFQPVLVFKDGSESVLDRPFSHETMEGYTSYDDVYYLTLSRKKAEELLSGTGHQYEDIDRVDYRVTVENDENTNYSGDHMLDVSIQAYCIADKEDTAKIPSEKRVIQGIGTTETYGDTILENDYDSMDFVFRVSYSGANVYLPTEAHKKAMMVTFDPKIVLILDDGSEILTDIPLDFKQDNYENYTFSANVPLNTLSKYLNDAGKTIDDLKAFAGYIDSAYPAGQGINTNSVIRHVTYRMNMDMNLKPGYKFSIRGGTLHGNYDAELPAKCQNVKILCNDDIDGMIVEADKDDPDRIKLSVVRDVESFDISFTFEMHKAEMTGYSDPSVKLKGDLNNDGVVNVTDIIKLAAHIKGKKMLPDPSAADFNNDSKINVNDLTKLAAHIKGKRLLS
ncbi:dockerin type I repeat-containing protein [Ruminococcus albus]|uniref:Dockerin domain-containing protein n=1 Tax=Ruminococcus albus TaxID=1264 RepID=A0A1I1DCT6_RUMAL|nr:dockerin type I repeat-containing protein [Ruminococcus albus]SFB70620.1 hypothetical protein SAMN02910406_00268 [Ruminococcus albus]